MNKRISCFWLVPVVLLAACGQSQESASSDTAQASASRAAPEKAHPGKEIYDNYCFSCHTPGLSGSPKLGDVEAWAPRIAKGRDLLLQTTIEGIPPAMPPRGICMDCSDEQLSQAIDYMVVKSQ